ncbi:hypothetical protein ACP275_05G123800 [Erythranthe tilingii]
MRSEKREEVVGRYGQESESDSDEATKKKTERHDRYEYDASRYSDVEFEEDERTRSKKTTQHHQTHRPQDPSADYRRKVRSDRHDKIGGRYGQESESDSDEATKKKTERRDRDERDLNAGDGRRNQTHDSGKDYNRKRNDSIERNRDNDKNRDRVGEVESVPKNRSGYGDESRGDRAGEKGYAPETDDWEKLKNKVSARVDTFKKLEQFSKSKGDGSGDRSEDTTRGKRKKDGSLDEQQPERKSRKLDSTKETGYEGTKVSSERQSKSKQPVEDNSKDSRPIIPEKRRDNRDNEDGQSRRERGDDVAYKRDRGREKEEHERGDVAYKRDRGGEKEDHERDEVAYKRDRGREKEDHERDGVAYKRDHGKEKDEHERDDVAYKRDRGREKEERERDDVAYKRDRGREKEEHERDGEYASKRARYDEGSSRGRRYDDGRNDDRRSRHR